MQRLKIKIEQWIIWMDRAMEFSLWGIVITLPFSISLLEIFFICTLISWGAKRIMERRSMPVTIFKPVSTDLNLPVAVFVFFAFLSTVSSTSLLLSLEGFFFKLAEWVMIYFITAEAINNERKIRNISRVILFSIALIAIDGIFQRLTGADFIRHFPSVGGYRIQGPFLNPNGFAGWLAAMLPLSVGLAYGSGDLLKTSKDNQWFKLPGKVVLWILAGLLTACLIFTYSRGGWIAALLAVVFLGILKSRKLLLSLAIILIAISLIAPASVKGRTGSMTRIFRESQEVDRISLWQEAVSIIKDFPLLGSGLNTYAVTGPYYRITEKTGFYPHNSYLQMAAESGVLGLGAFLWILIILFKTSINRIKRINDKFYGTMLAGLLAGLSGLMIHSFVDTDLYSLQLGNLAWLMMGLIVAVQKVSLQKNL